MIAFASNQYTYAAPIQFSASVDGRRSDRRRRRRRSESPTTRKQQQQQQQQQQQSLSLSQSQEQRVPLAARSGSASASTTPPLLSASSPSPGWRRESVQDVLRSTAIPIRRKYKPRSSQRIPDGDHVADFSRLLRDDIRAGGVGGSGGSLPSGSLTTANPLFDGLFGHIDELVEGEMMIVGSEGLDSSILLSASAQSLSVTDSTPSLASPDDYSSADNISVTHSTIRSPPPSDRRIKQLATSEDCAAEHPLLGSGSEEDAYVDEGEEGEGEGAGGKTMDFTMLPLRKRSPSADKTEKASSFKSSLTASLKAIKLAAQSVSNYGGSSGSGRGRSAIPPLSFIPDAFGNASVFDFQPALTDDRRPPPLQEPPSPALRRYLNPSTAGSMPDSPAQLHFWIEPRTIPPPAESAHDGSYRPKIKIKKKNGKPAAAAGSGEGAQTPPLVPMTTCIPSQIRTAHASSPPVWLAADGTPLNGGRSSSSPSSSPSSSSSSSSASASWEGTEAGLKQCEPRENRDFLRIYVCEMQMRRAKKLRADAEGRARMWLPPVEKGRRASRPAAERLSVWLAHEDEHADDDDGHDEHDHEHDDHRRRAAGHKVAQQG